MRGLQHGARSTVRQMALRQMLAPISTRLRMATVPLVLVASSGLVGESVAGASAPIDSAPIVLPDQLGGLNALDLATSYPGDSPPSPEVLDRIRAAQDFNAAGFSAALGGVAAASRRYAPEALAPLYDVLAVRAWLSALTPRQFVDPDAVGLAKPVEELVVVGEVNCVVNWRPVAAEGEVTDEDRLAVTCQGVSNDVTIRVAVVGEEQPQPEDVAALVLLALDEVA
jgi:hypothetical protein